MVRRNKVPAKPTKAAVARLGALAVEAGALLALSLVLAACDSPTDSDDDDWYYSPTYYDITFSVGEGSGTPPASERTSTFYPPGQGNMTAPEGKYFMGWSSSSGGSIDYLPGRVYHISGDKTLTAQWGPGYTITFSAGTGSGTPPASQTAAAGEVINLPGQGDMTASDDNYSYLFNGWKLSSGGTPSETTYRDRDEYTVTGDCTFTAYWMTGFHLYTFTFSTGEGSGTPPPSQKTSESITLPGQGDMTAPAGKYFSGWKSDRDYSTIYEAGSTYTASGYYYSYEVTLTAQWSSKGVYVGIHSFAGGVTNIWDGYTDTRISNLSYLNSTGRSSLISGLNNYYKRGSASGTALYYAVHRALANLKEAESRFETASIQSVNLITFTDGLDNASFGASNNSPIEDKSGVTSVDYAAYIKEQIGSRTIGGKPITAYSIGVKGSDVTDTAAFDTTLSNIASAGNTHTLTDFSGLEAKLKEIADGIEISSEINFTMQTTQNDPGT
ncbi:MAG: InlB B-repeat-containing protein, partial [Treponema sp.]|nr:InlB B-repeat-containing protein [Treponema sp.]